MPPPKAMPPPPRNLRYLFPVTGEFIEGPQMSDGNHWQVRNMNDEQYELLQPLDGVMSKYVNDTVEKFEREKRLAQFPHKTTLIRYALDSTDWISHVLLCNDYAVSFVGGPMKEPLTKAITSIFKTQCLLIGMGVTYPGKLAGFFIMERLSPEAQEKMSDFVKTNGKSGLPDRKKGSQSGGISGYGEGGVP